MQEMWIKNSIDCINKEEVRKILKSMLQDLEEDTNSKEEQQVYASIPVNIDHEHYPIAETALKLAIQWLDCNGNLDDVQRTFLRFYKLLAVRPAEIERVS